MFGFERWWVILLILAIVLIVYGPGKLPEVGGAIGKAFREFRRASSDLQDEITGSLARRSRSGVALLWPDLPTGLRLPVAGYSTLLTAMAYTAATRLGPVAGLGGTLFMLSDTLIATGVWYHLAAVRGSNFTQIYVNGQLERQTNVSFALDYGNQPLYFTRPVDKFLLYFKIGLFGGLILAAPIIFWQVWGFIAPGLRRNERRFAIGFVASASLLFVLGIFFAFFALPIALRFLIGFGTSDIKYFPLAASYINFALLLIAIFGITFELPLALTMMGLAGIVTPAFLNHNRVKFWLGIFIGSNFVTPGADPFTPLLLTVPLIVLFEVSIQVIRALRK